MDRIVFAGRLMTVSQMMQVIHRAGWEIGLHGSYYSATENGILGYEREQIQSVIKDPVISIRQHWLHYDITRTPRLQMEAGFRCDSTQDSTALLDSGQAPRFRIGAGTIEHNQRFPFLKSRSTSWMARSLRRTHWNMMLNSHCAIVFS